MFDGIHNEYEIPNTRLQRTWHQITAGLIEYYLVQNLWSINFVYVKNYHFLLLLITCIYAYSTGSFFYCTVRNICSSWSHTYSWALLREFHKYFVYSVSISCICSNYCFSGSLWNQQNIFKIIDRTIIYSTYFFHNPISNWTLIIFKLHMTGSL